MKGQLALELGEEKKRRPANWEDVGKGAVLIDYVIPCQKDECWAWCNLDGRPWCSCTCGWVGGERGGVLDGLCRTHRIVWEDEL